MVDILSSHGLAILSQSAIQGDHRPSARTQVLGFLRAEQACQPPHGELSIPYGREPESPESGAPFSPFRTVSAEASGPGCRARKVCQGLGS